MRLPKWSRRVQYNPGVATSGTVLAGDVGGTKTLLGLFECGEGRPRPLIVRSYPTAAFGSFIDILDAFAQDVGGRLRVDAAAVGAAGPVVDRCARLTNVVWDVGAQEIAARLGLSRAGLLNDLMAMATSAEVLTPGELVTLQAGTRYADGNAVVIAAGTGLGQAFLHRVDGRLCPMASEGGHADFAPRTDREIELLQMLRAEYGRAEVEHVLSGPGLLNVYRFTHSRGTCPVVDYVAQEGWTAAISQAAMTGQCGACVEALSIFVGVYGAEAGNLAVRGVATAGVYVGGGIAPKILPLLKSATFLDAFLAKGVMSDLVGNVPVNVIVNAEAGLLGAAVYAQSLLDEV